MMTRGRCLGLVGVLLLAACAGTPLPGGPLAATANAPAMERHFAALKTMPARLTAFLRAMPKGGDLHSHLSGAIYAESYIAWAQADGLCLIVASHTFTMPPCDAPAGKPPVSEAVADAAAYNALIDALSVRNYERRPVSGHDQFFATFARFGAAGDRRGPDMQAEVMARAADQNIRYLELMTSTGMSAARKLGTTVGWDDDPGRLLKRLRTSGLDEIARQTAVAFADGDAAARRKLSCEAPTPAPACGVTVRYLAQVIRVFPREQVFAQIALGFLLAEQSRLVVGLNLVAPEDDRVSLADYSAHMRMIGALRIRFPDVRVSLHAGELALGLVPPEELRLHIAEAVRIAGASRIGHGVDILHEDNPEALLAEMAARRIMVEVNLTSNGVILGVAGADHPFETYRAFGVPLALSTDDEGVSRIDLTHEYRRAVQTYDLGYRDVKHMSRNSLTYAFIDGDSLWADAERAIPVSHCERERPGAARPAAACATFLAGSAKATLQWALEAAFGRFEREWVGLAR